MKEMLVQFKSGRTLTVKDICDYVESQDFDVVVSRGDKKEAHITVFHDAVEYMSVIDDISDHEETIKDPDDISFDKGCSNCAYKERGFTESPCNECYCGGNVFTDDEYPKWKKED